ncbi:hypothetical protein ACFOY4_07555 [Actinomadura syzygii]|uniref:TlpA family protein disulfide reductase n=1 Tax=Actinomadura syzygii TaxID=1427538 RepID=A0A5D0UFH9_9ACTN|nr:TlpA family protein disulfide reductase [Actinomadura syzygii]TYC16814.1 TlpA family protein disulfide reductase [Actinomadura syzygii]
MPYLAAAVVLVGLIAVLNLLLTLALARRLKEPGAAGTTHSGPPVVLRPGSRPAAFASSTTDGEPVTDATLPALVAFFSAGCGPCHAQAPSVAEHARAAGRENVLAVIAGDDPELVVTLAPDVRLVVEEDQAGPVSAAFQNEWTPALYLMGDDRTVLATGGRLTDLPLPARG